MKALDKVTFELRFKEEAKATPSAVKAKLPKKYTVNTFSIELGGDLAVSDKEDEKGLWLVAKSGQKYRLANRQPKDENDKPEDVVAKLQSAHDAGDKKAKAKGTVTEGEDGVATLALEKAEVVKEEAK